MVYILERDVRYLDALAVGEIAPFVVGLLALTVITIHMIVGWIAEDSRQFFTLVILQALGFALGVGKIARLTQRKMVRISIHDSTMRLMSAQGIVLRTLDLRAYVRVEFGASPNEPLLRLVTHVGVPTEIRERAITFPSRATAHHRLARELSRIFPRGSVPMMGQGTDTNAIAQYFTHHGFAPPAVAMQTGVRYRYRDHEALATFLERPGIAPGMKNVHLGFALLMTYSLNFLSGAWILTIIWMLAVLLLWHFYIVAYRKSPRQRFLDSLGDTFEIVPEGLWVTCQGRSWIVTDPHPAIDPGERLIVAQAAVVRYRDKNGRAYYFDPRLIEPIAD